MSGRGVRKVFLHALLTALLAALLAAPAAAQGSEDGPIYTARVDGEPFKLYADGAIVTGGDVVGGCEALVRDAYPKPVEPDRGLLRQVAICEEFGFEVPGSEALPETGGPPLPVVAALGLILSIALCYLGLRRPGLSGDS